MVLPLRLSSSPFSHEEYDASHDPPVGGKPRFVITEVDSSFSRVFLSRSPVRARIDADLIFRSSSNTSDHVYRFEDWSLDINAVKNGTARGAFRLHLARSVCLICVRRDLTQQIGGLNQVFCHSGDNYFGSI
jgi:hypothetical protein